MSSPPADDRLSVVIADDDPLTRRALRTVLSSDAITVVGEAATGREAVAQASALTPDVLLMDIRMPEMDGLEATREIVRLPGVDTRVLVLTTFPDEEAVHEALRSGASGFLLKNAPPEELVSAVRVVAAGDQLLAPEVTRMVVERYLSGSPPADDRHPEGLSLLTPRETDVLRHVAAGLSNREIASALVLGEATVKTHVGRLLMKLGARDRAQLVVVAYQSGLVRRGDRT